MRLTEKDEAAFQSSAVKALGDQMDQLFQGKNCNDILGVSLSAAIVAARELGMSKLDLQKVLIGVWDAEVRQRQADAPQVPAGGNT
jgi:hypothetical protein